MAATDEQRIDPVEELWLIREKIYEEIKDLTPEERCLYWQESDRRFNELMKDRKPRPDLFPWLTSQKETV
jgi:hypothetical protein